jgi:Ca-activated chloride channel family protein
MTFEPLFELWTTVLLLAPPTAILVWQLLRSWRPAKGIARGTWRTRANPIRRLLIVALLAFAAAGPAVPGAMTKVVVSDVDVFLVIDTTTSSNAEDAGFPELDDGTTRLDQIKEDAFEVATRYGGARYSVITFDNGSLVRLPLVADPTALQTTLDTLEVELSTYAGGSSISEPLETLLKRLKGAQSDHPERLRLVFYFGDGEQTRDDTPDSMAEAAAYIGDGAVFGYGTEDGGPMRPNLDFGVQLDPAAPDPAPAPYLHDTTQSGDPIAISRIDEDALKTIASELGVGYQHRIPGTEPSYPDVEDRMGEEIEVPEVAVAERLYWIPVLAAFALLLWDLVLAGRNVGDLRAARPPRTPREPRTPPPPRGAGS